MRRVARVVDKRDVARLRLFDAGDAGDLDVPVAFQPAFEPAGQIAELHQRVRCTFCGGRGGSVNAGRPACSHAETMTDAVAVIAADSRSSSSGFTFTKNDSK